MAARRAGRRVTNGGPVIDRSAGGAVPHAARDDRRPEGVAIAPGQMSAVLEGPAVLVVDRFEELEKWIPLGQAEELSDPPVGGHRPEDALGSRRLDPVRLAEGPEQR